MKKTFKRAVALVLFVLMLAATMATGSVFAADTETDATGIIYTEDFEDYENMTDPVTGPSQTVGDWTTSTVWKGWQDGLKLQSITLDDGNTVLAAMGTDNSWGASNLKLENIGANDDFVFKTDMKHSGWNSRNNDIRICVNEKETSYYALRMGTNPYNPMTMSFHKVTGDTATEYTYSKSDVAAINNAWVTLELKKTGNLISYSVTKKADGVVVFSGNYVDLAPLATTGKISVASNSGIYNYYDNMEVSAVAPVIVEPEDNLYREDFEDYENMEAALTGPNQTVGDWTTSNTWKGWNDGVMLQSLTLDDGNTVLAARGTDGSWGASVLNIEADPDMDFMFKTDLAYTHWSNRNNDIRICVDSTQKKYYALRMGTNPYNPMTMSFLKVTGDSATEYTYSESNIAAINDGWVTVELRKSGNTIYYSVAKKADGTVIFEGSYNDPSPLETTGRISVASNSGQPNYYDNMVAGSVDPFVGAKEDPATIMYQDIASDATVETNTEYKYVTYTFEDAQKIRRVMLDGLETPSAVSVYLAESIENSISTWTKLGELSAEGNILNTTAVQQAKTVIIVNHGGDDFTVDGVKILNEADLTKTYQLDEETVLKLYPRLGGEDKFDGGVWSVSDDKVAMADGAYIKAVGFGTTTATASFGDASLSVKVEANKPVTLLYTEDFEDYENMEAALTGPGKKVGDWSTSSQWKGWNDGVSMQSITLDDGNTVLAEMGTNNSWGTANLKLKPDEKKDFMFKTDMKLTHWGVKSAGIRMSVQDGETVFYDLRITGNPYNPITISFNKVAETEEDSYIDSVSEIPAINLTWVTLEMRKSGNVITYSVTKKDSGEVLFAGSYDDPSPIKTNGRIAIASNSGYMAYYDNMVAGSVDTYIDEKEEAVNMMYENATANKPVYAEDTNAGVLNDGKTDALYTFAGDVVIDMQRSGIIRKVVASGVNGTVDMYVSDDNATWYYLEKITEDGEIVNTKTNNLYRYIKLSSNGGSASEIKVYTEVDNLDVRIGSKLHLVPRIDSYDTDAAVWTYSADGYVTASGNELVPSKETDSAVKVTATEVGNSVSIDVDVIREYSVNTSGGGLEITLGSAYYTENAKYIAAFYGENDKLISASEVELPYSNTNVDTMTLDIETPADYKKLKLLCWDGSFAGVKPLTQAKVYEKGEINEYRITYPTFTNKSMSINYDDGIVEPDKRVMEIMDKNDIKGTFNLAYNNVPEFYNTALEHGHELANHSSHIAMSNAEVYTLEDCKKSILSQHEKMIEAYGVTPRNFMWPYQAPVARGEEEYEALKDYLRELGYVSARHVGFSSSFSMPEDWMEWRCTYTLESALWYDYHNDVVNTFLNTEDNEELLMFSVWTHAAEVAPDETNPDAGPTAKVVKNFDAFCAKFNRPDVWRATTIDIYDYYMASKNVEVGKDYIYNPSETVTLYGFINGEKVVIPPMSSAVAYTE